MLAARIHGFGGPDVFRLDEVADPQPAHGEVLVRICAVGVNFYETELRAGVNPALPLPHTLGMDGAGIVESLGAGVTGLNKGDRVGVYSQLACHKCPQCVTGFANRCQQLRRIGVHTSGTYAELIAIPAWNAVPIASLPFRDVASALTPYSTAWNLLRRRAALAPGHTILVIGAGGSVGTAAVQIARLSGATVFAATSGADKMKALQELGAAAVFDYLSEDPWQEARELTHGQGLDFVVDYGGSKTVGRSLTALTKGGSVLVIGSIAGDTLEKVDLRALYSNHRSLIGHGGSTRADVLAVLSHMTNRQIHPVHGEAFPLREVSKAHAAMTAPSRFGSINLIPEHE